MLYAYGNVPLSQKLLLVRDRAKERSMAIELLFRRDVVKISVTTKKSSGQKRAKGLLGTFSENRF